MTLINKLAEVRNNALKILREKLPLELTYHSYEHTLDVLNATEIIAIGEIVTETELALLKTAAVFHDIGYIYSRENHEEKSCAIAREKLEELDIDFVTIETVCRLILATRIPQKPTDKLSQILCDADLDYLGRDDYFPISQNVFLEFKRFGVVKNEPDWKEMQIKFLESHKYFTVTANRLRENKKRENLIKIKNNEMFEAENY